MSIHSEPEYLNVEKNRWRLDKWSAIKELVSETRNIKDAVVVYLPGPNDLDRDVAVRFGFKTYNLIGIDADAGIIATNRARAKRGVFIRGRLEDLIANLPLDFDIAAIDADLCCGLQASAHALMRCMITDALIPRDIVLAVNLQRGRDPASNHIREMIGARKAACGFDIQKHRGANFLVQAFRCIDENYSSRSGSIDCDMLMPRPWIMHSYKSNRVYMDSIVFRWRTKHMEPMRLTNKPDAKRNRALWAAARATRTRYLKEISRAHAATRRVAA